MPGWRCVGGDLNDNVRAVFQGGPRHNDEGSGLTAPTGIEAELGDLPTIRTKQRSGPRAQVDGLVSQVHRLGANPNQQYALARGHASQGLRTSAPNLRPTCP
jgi:hypothetical protein